jgi:pimeloyl-ACP methyl ester carboxylesterase
VLLAALAMTAGDALAEPTARRENYPCKGCLFDPPAARSDRAPLLVVLHGDAPGGGTPKVARDASPWARAAAERGVALFAPMCPRELGCRAGSFWQWNEGDPPGWIAAQIDVIAKDHAIDPDRVWIAGWSGGASFLGWHFARLGERYAAVVFAGGGIPPKSAECPSCALPAYFLVGDKNPLHHLAVGLRERVAACEGERVWDLLPGKRHDGEWTALAAPGKAASLLDWLDKHPRACRAEAEKPAEPPPAEPLPPAPAPVSSPRTSTPATAPPPAPPAAPAHCGCEAPGGERAHSFLTAFALAGCVWWLRRATPLRRRAAAGTRTEMGSRKAS